MTRKLLLYLCLATLTQCSQCKKNDPTPLLPKDPLSLLPPETQTGAGTFGCLINGQTWALAGSPLGGPLLSAEYYNEHLLISASGLTADKTSSGGVVQIGIGKITSTGSYSLIKRDTSFVSYDDARTNCMYYTNALHPAQVDITRLDQVNRIVSGRFSFTLEMLNCGTLRVTSGRFDVKF